MATATETIQLRTRTGLGSTATATVTRRSGAFRVVRSLGIGVGGVVVGLATVVIPAVHLISTWAIPLAAIAIALVLLRQGPAVDTAAGPCPKCGAAIEVAGGTVADDLWVACPACAEPLRFELTPPTG